RAPETDGGAELGRGARPPPGEARRPLSRGERGGHQGPPPARARPPQAGPAPPAPRGPPGRGRAPPPAPGARPGGRAGPPGRGRGGERAGGVEPDPGLSGRVRAEADAASAVRAVAPVEVGGLHEPPFLADPEVGATATGRVARADAGRFLGDPEGPEAPPVRG